MLKSLITQFLATLILGPLGLAYSSMAAAVFLTLILAVLYFTELGLLAVLIVWPIAIFAGLIFVQMHNEHIRTSGGRLLLGPDDDEDEMVSAYGSWGRGVAVLAVLVAVSYFAYWNSAERDNPDQQVAGESSTDAESAAVPARSPEQVVDTSVADADLSGSSSAGETAETELPIAQTFSIDNDTDESQSEDGFSVITLEEQEFQPIVIGTSSQPLSDSGNRLYVDTKLVNLREGPGTGFAIITTVQRGVELSEVDRSGNWVEVITTDSGARGWVFNNLVSTEP